MDRAIIRKSKKDLFMSSRDILNELNFQFSSVDLFPKEIFLPKEKYIQVFNVTLLAPAD